MSERVLIALDGGEPVGTAFISGDPRSVRSRRPYVEITVPPRNRGRGVATALLAAVSRHARALRYEALRCTAQEDDAYSISFLQRRMGLGYPKAARFIDMMEQDRIIGPGQGAKPREILVGPDYLAKLGK